MSPKRNDQGSSSGRSAEQRERDRLEREARRAASQRTAPTSHDPHPPTSDPYAPNSPPIDEPSARRGQRVPAGDAPADVPPRRGRRLASGEAPADPPRRASRGRSQRPTPGEPPPELPPTVDRAADRRAARRLSPADREPASVLRIQPEPPAPPAAPAGALGDEFDRPIGIRRVRHAVTPRPARTIVTPPGDVPAGPARARRSVGARIGVLIALLLLAAAIVIGLLVFQPFGSAQGDAVRVTIKQGASAREIGNQLADAGVVSSGAIFSFRATLAGKRADLRSGPHTLHKDMTYGAAIDALSKRPA
ncbi:MAG: hypothetical protein QOJ46_683, partial [bacterium]